jgi:hypothetical protein
MTVRQMRWGMVVVSLAVWAVIGCTVTALVQITRTVEVPSRAGATSAPLGAR